jgi:hypothetical protein
MKRKAMNEYDTTKRTKLGNLPLIGLYFFTLCMAVGVGIACFGWYKFFSNTRELSTRDKAVMKTAREAMIDLCYYERGLVPPKDAQ